MEKLEAVLAALRKRAALLADKKISGQAALDAATGARQAMLLDGDLEDQKLAAKLQSAVDAAQNSLLGIIDAVAALNNSITDAERQVNAERLSAARKTAAEQIAANVAAAERLIGPWLAASREIAAVFRKLDHTSFEAGKIGGFIANTASEVEVAVAVVLPELRSLVKAVANGDSPIPPAAEVVVPAAAPPKPVTVRLFALKAVTWIDTEGRQRRIGKYNDIDLPERAAAFALKKGLCVELTDPRRKELHGLSPGHPEPHWCTDLDNGATVADTIAPATELEPIKHSAFEQPPPGFQPLDRGRPYVIRTQAGNASPEEAA
jgi:hypothetical protein